MPVKILVVDDEPDLEMLIEQKFRKKIQQREVEFLYAQTGHEAIDKLHQDKDIGIVITNVNMPQMNGFELLFEMGKFDRVLKSVIVSPYGDLDSIRKAMNLGAYDFVTRPINLDDLEMTILKTISNLKTTKEMQSNQLRLIEIDKEIDVAKSIQNSIIPQQFCPYPGNTNFEIIGTMIPAKKIGGDFYDFFPLPQNKLGFCIADVSGKGIPAALFMTMTRGLLRSLGQKTASPAECLKQLNDLLAFENSSSMFVTAFYGILDVMTGLITYANAGHNPPYHIKSINALSQVARGEGIALGITSEINDYRDHTIKLEKNDIFLLYTDGITEAMNSEKELYGEARFEESLQKVKSEPLGAMLKGIVDSVETFAGAAEQNDDITLLAIKFLS